MLPGLDRLLWASAGDSYKEAKINIYLFQEVGGRKYRISFTLC